MDFSLIMCQEVYEDNNKLSANLKNAAVLKRVIVDFYIDDFYIGG